ncbi:MAG: type II toxin-antitoxin system PemK/MazF family toxin [Chloroflexota bacterium]|nr:type II toxin-antitoxin system PemK/MazF family toxin [Chloroflexota bacterium]
MTDYKAGDVILVSFPFGERISGQKRPAVVVSSTAHNQATSELLIAQITSNVTVERHGDFLIQQWKKANLLTPSVVRARLATIQDALVLRKLGELEPDDLTGLKTVLESATA